MVWLFLDISAGSAWFRNISQWAAEARSRAFMEPTREVYIGSFMKSYLGALRCNCWLTNMTVGSQRHSSKLCMWNFRTLLGRGKVSYGASMGYSVMNDSSHNTLGEMILFVKWPKHNIEILPLCCMFFCFLICRFTTSANMETPFSSPTWILSRCRFTFEYSGPAYLMVASFIIVSSPSPLKLLFFS